LHVEVSASEIREQISAGWNNASAGDELLPKGVFEAIQSRGLYR